MLLYSNEEVKYEGCPGCAFAKHQFEIPCKMAYENDNFTLSQDWELPIPGFFVVSPKRHVEKLSELTDEERNEMFAIVNQTVSILREGNVCENFEYVFEEKPHRHLHVWIMPRHKWMGKDIITNIGTIFDYAKKEFRNEETYQLIDEISGYVRKKIKEKGKNK